MEQPERHDIFVRAHTPVRTKAKWKRQGAHTWPEYCLVFDTETTIDTSQKLNFGCYRRCRLDGDNYRCIEEGLFYADRLPSEDLDVLDEYKRTEKNSPAIEWFPAQMTLGLMSRSAFISRVFWKAVQRGDLIVGFNLPFDISRLAVRAANGRKSSWSIALSTRKGRKTGELEVDSDKPRIVITSQNSKMAFIKLGSILHPEEWTNEGRFLDLRTLGWGLRNEAYSLKRACKAFGVNGKIEHKPTGKLTPKEIE
jgi:hypothetical protein